MGALRVCACGAELEEAGDALICSGCGARAQSWRVFLNGKAMAVGTISGHAREALVAFAPGFEEGLLGFLEDPPRSIRYAIPSSWRRRHRTPQA